MLEKKSSTYFDSIAGEYDSLYVDNLSIAENKIVQKLILKLLEHRNNISMLDLGCGTGLTYELLRDHIAMYHGEDISQKMLDLAGAKFSEVDGLQFTNSDINNSLYLSSDKTDAVDLVASCFGSASYIDNLEGALNHVYNKLRTNGVAFLMFYSQFSARNIMNAHKGIQSESLQTYRRYTFRKDSSHKTDESPKGYFYDSKVLSRIAEKTLFKSYEISGLNFFLDSMYSENSPGIDTCIELLEEERSRISIPDLAHSLILALRK